MALGRRRLARRASRATANETCVCVEAPNLNQVSRWDGMGILKGLLGADADKDLLDDVEVTQAFAAAEAAVDRAIEQRMAASAVANSIDTLPRSSEDRRKGDGVRPDGLPDRRSGQDRRTGFDRRSSQVEFGRRR